MNRSILIAAALLATESVAAADLPRCDRSLKVAHLPAPEYPPSGRTPEGLVLVEFTVDVRGNASDAKIMETSNERLSALVLRETVRWRFTPPKQPCRHQVPITFQVKD